MHRLCKSIILLAALCSAACTSSDSASHVAFVGGSVIDGTGAPPHQGWTVLIRDSVITAVGPDVEIPGGAEFLDISGKTVLPGLIDMHGHMYAMGGNQFTAYPRLFLAGGVTTVFSPGDLDPDGMTALRDQINRGEVVGPRILTAGITRPSMAGPWGEGNSEIDSDWGPL